ncbi:MAG: hypothetical protein ACOC84_07705 [Actinomycetota bacterium]
MTGPGPGSIVGLIDRTSFPPRPPQWTDDRAAPALSEELLTRQSAPVDVLSGADPAVLGYRSAFRELLDRNGL